MGFLSYLTKTIEPTALLFTSEDDRKSVHSNMTASEDESSNNTPGSNSTPSNTGNTLNLSVSGGGMDGNITSASSTDNEKDYLARELEKVKREYQEQIEREQAIILARENKHAMSRVFGRMPTYQGQDQINYGPVNKLAREMFVEMKHLNKNWSVHSDKRQSLYQRIVKCSGVTIPEGWDEYAYFKKVLARVFATKYRSLRTNYITFCREAYLGKCRVLFVMRCMGYYTDRFDMMSIEDAEKGIDRRMKTFDLLIGNKKTTFTKVLRRNHEELAEGRKVWEDVTLHFYHFVMDYVVGLYSKASYV